VCDVYHGTTWTTWDDLAQDPHEPRVTPCGARIWNLWEFAGIIIKVVQVVPLLLLQRFLEF
jgi:hypothetical protein